MRVDLEQSKDSMSLDEIDVGTRFWHENVLKVKLGVPIGTDVKEGFCLVFRYEDDSIHMLRSMAEVVKEQRCLLIKKI